MIEMNTNECCSVVNLCGCPVCIFCRGETYIRNEILAEFMNGIFKGNDMIIGDVACLFPDRKTLSNPQDSISFPSPGYADKVCLVFRATRNGELIFDGVYLFEKKQNKYIRQHAPVSVTSFGKVVLASGFPSIFFGDVGNGLFSNVVIGVSREGGVCLKKENLLVECLKWIAGFVPIVLIGLGCFCAYKTICVQSEKIDAEVSWRVLLGPDGTNSVTSSLSGSVVGNNRTNLTIQIEQ